MLRKLLFFIPTLLLAHPMGNFSVSHYTRLNVTAKGVNATYSLDLGEVPTFDLLREWKLEASSSQADLLAKANGQMQTWIGGLDFEAGGKPVAPKLESVDMALSEGSAGLPVARITARLSLPGVLSGTLTFADRNFPDRAGWKEIVITASDGVALTTASHSSEEHSNALTAYPSDALTAGPQDLRAELTWTTAVAGGAPPVIRPIPQPAPPAVSQSSAPSGLPAAKRPDATGDYLSRLLSNKKLTPWMIVVGLLAAFGIGAVHATSPGHGKTLVAAYLVGSKGTMKHAVILGAMTTFTHTISVFALGLVTLFLSQYILPETLLPWLGAISGLSIVAVGGSLFLKRLAKLRAAGKSHSHSHHHDHSHAHVHTHSHDHHHDHDHAHAHAHGIPHSHGLNPDRQGGDSDSNDHALVHDHGDGHAHSHDVPSDITIGGLIALGASGGLVPCPSALVLLLTSIALGRIGLGLVLLTSFSLGLATVLVGIGVLVLYAKSFLPQSKKLTEHPAFRLVPILSAAVIVIIGFLMTGVSLGWVRGFSA